jgi:hypothetical protein
MHHPSTGPSLSVGSPDSGPGAGQYDVFREGIA